MLTLLLVGAAAVAILAVIGRPLLFASIDTGAWRPRTRDTDACCSGLLFLVPAGVAAAEVSQITGTLLVFALLVVPAATAQLVTPHPLKSLLLATGFGLAITWLGSQASPTTRSTP